MGEARGPAIGTGLRLARQARGFTQQRLADMTGMARQTVVAVESGLGARPVGQPC
jgi:transcriptional regulator with XRE-family HTH domain